MSLRPAFLVVAAACGLSLVGCTQSTPDDGFGKAKPTTDNGMVGKPQPLPEAPPDWNSALAVVPAYDQANQQLLVLLKIKPGFHAYGPGEEVSKPVAMSVTATNGWSVDGAVDIPAGAKKDLGVLGTSVILEGDVPLKAKLKPGSGAIEGVVEVQVCTDKACDRPRKHPFTIPAA
ncbi:MAG TPA: protein-disulfide reductase DsbD domain-containing protein [Myxococcota bacterium]